MVSPIPITVYNKAFQRVGWIGDPERVTLNLRHNQQPSGAISLRSDHSMLPKLLTPGCRLVCEYAGQQVMSGPVNHAAGSGAPDGTVTVQLRDDFGVLTDLLGWPVPTSPIATQSAFEYDTKTGPAETVLKWFVGRAITRLGLPITVAADQARGLSITVQMRMHGLADRLFPAVDQAGIGVSVRQSGAGLVVDCYTTALYGPVLTPSSGIVTAFEWSRTAPTATRVVVGGPGEGTARTFAASVDTALEAEWGLVREQFIDATDTGANLAARGAAALAAGGPATGLKLTLAETDTFRYGTLRVGDLVSTELVPGAPQVTDVLREAVISWSKDDGLTVTPIVGERDDDPARTMARAVAALSRRVKNKELS